MSNIWLNLLFFFSPFLFFGTLSKKTVDDLHAFFPVPSLDLAGIAVDLLAKV
jgi:hypothetical protein